MDRSEARRRIVMIIDARGGLNIPMSSMSKIVDDIMEIFDEAVDPAEKVLTDDTVKALHVAMREVPVTFSVLVAIPVVSLIGMMLCGGVW